MTSNNKYPEGYLTVDDQDETHRNEAVREGNVEVRRMSSALDGFDSSIYLPRNHIDARTRETSTTPNTNTSTGSSASASASNGIIINRTVPSTVIMEEDMNCNISPYSMLDMPLYLPSVTHQGILPSLLGFYQPAASRMTRERLIEILNEALSIMDDDDGDDDNVSVFSP